jgi:hypothetical protein
VATAKKMMTTRNAINMNFAYLGSLFLATTTTTAVRIKAIM